MQQPLLSIDNLSVDFISGHSVTQAVKNISFKVNSGEIVALVGESGSGKSVTALSILQLIPSPPAQYTSGAILFANNNGQHQDLLKITKADLKKLRGNDIAMIFQEPMTSLNPVFTCGNQVQEAILQHKAISAAEAKAETVYWFEKVKLPHPKEIYTRYPHQLSGGQKQRVMIAMAMCCHPSLLICDEPTTALDVTVQKTILHLIKDLQQETGMGVIFITHDLGVVGEIADRAVVMYRGEIIEQGNIGTLFTSPQQAYTKALLACRPVNHPKGIRLPVVDDFLNHNPQPVHKNLQKDTPASVSVLENTNTIIKADHVSVWFPATKNWLGRPLSYTKAVDDVSFEVYENETLGIVGESGCGKTTLGRALLQLIPVSQGKIFYRGTELSLHTAATMRTLRQQLQIVFQDPYSSLNPRKKIGAAIEEPLIVYNQSMGKSERKQKVITLLEKVGLTADHYNRYPHEFSGGQRQRIVIARALALRPAFIVCDESVSALDVSVQAQVLNLLNDLKREMHFTIVFISHDLSVVRYISDRIMVIHAGKIVETGKADAIYLHPQQPYTQKLIAAIPKGI